jgi:hypothetical protein
MGITNRSKSITPSQQQFGKKKTSFYFNTSMESKEDL